MEGKRSELAVVKQKVRLQEWSAQVEAQQASGLNVREWCAENGIAPNTYYNHLKRVREQFLSSSPAIVPLNVPQQSSDIRIEKNGLCVCRSDCPLCTELLPTLAASAHVCAHKLNIWYT